MKRVLQFALRLYQRFVSPALPHACRYVPTCSEYTMLAIELHGALGGSWLAAKRLLRCHPLGGSGYDPVPMPSASSRETCQAHENENAAGGVLVCSKDH